MAPDGKRGRARASSRARAVLGIPRAGDADARGHATIGRALRITTRPDWPLISGLALALVALLEAWLYTERSDDAPTTILLALLATLPLIVAARHLRRGRGRHVATVFVIGSGDATPLTRAGIVAQAWMLYLWRRALPRAGWRWRSARARAGGRVSDGKPALQDVLLLALGIGALGGGELAPAGRGGDRGAGRPGGARGAGADRARTARRRRPPRVHDRHPGRHGAAGDAGMPPEGGEQLEAIGQTARDAMTEMRRCSACCGPRPASGRRSRARSARRADRDRAERGDAGAVRARGSAWRRSRRASS